MMKQRIRQAGVTLIEVLLVTVIISAFIWMGVGYVQQRAGELSRDKTALQMQQILNAGLAYYVANGSWPSSADISGLQPNYLAAGTIQSPWGTNYVIGSTEEGLFYIWVPVTTTSGDKAKAYAQVIAGQLPFGYTSGDAAGVGGVDATPPDPSTACDTAGTTCYVVSYVNVPGQNLSNAGAINFAGLYHHGACVPVPTCPVDANGNTMTPQVMIVPVSVSGVNDTGSTDVYPISSFTAYAMGSNPLNSTPPLCQGQTGDKKVFYSGGTLTNNTSCAPLDLQGNGISNTKYWRACLQVITERGDVQQTRADGWGENVTLMAITRCAISNEPSGSAFTVYGN